MRYKLPISHLGLLLTALLSQAAWAESTPRIDYSTLTAQPYIEPLRLVQNDSMTTTELPAMVSPAPAEEFSEPLFNGNKMHKYLGIGSLALATLAALSPKEEDGPHEYFAKGAAALGGAAVASGLVVHWDDISAANGFSDPDNQHALLSTLGALGFMLAVSQAPDASHVGPGSIGFVAMAVGMRITW